MENLKTDQPTALKAYDIYYVAKNPHAYEVRVLTT